MDDLNDPMNTPVVGGDDPQAPAAIPGVPVEPVIPPVGGDDSAQGEEEIAPPPVAPVEPPMGGNGDGGDTAPTA